MYHATMPTDALAQFRDVMLEVTLPLTQTLTQTQTQTLTLTLTLTLTDEGLRIPERARCRVGAGQPRAT